MLTFLPVLLILFLAGLIFALYWSEQGRRYAWLISVFGLLITWIGLFSLHWFRLPEAVFPAWRPYEPLTADQIIFRWDDNGWVYAVNLVGLLLAVVLTAPVRFKYNSNPLSWSSAMVFTAVGLLSILSGSPLALAISWTLLDVIEVVYVMLIIRDYRFRREVLTSFALRIFSVGLLISVIILARQPGLGFTFANVLPADLPLLILAVILRLGVLPLNLRYEKELPLQNGLTSLMRITGQISGLALLAKLPAGVAVGEEASWIYVIILLLIFYASVMWLLSENEIAGRTFWGLSFSGLAILSALQGKAPFSTVWGVAIICWGGMIYLFTVRSQRLRLLMAMALLSFSGLPFTVLSSGWQTVASNTGLTILTSIIWLVMGAGFIRHIFSERESSKSFEPYIVTTYTLGLVVLLVAAWVSVGLGLQNGFQAGIWWGSIPMFGFLAFSGQKFFRGKSSENVSYPQAVWVQNLVQKLIGLMSGFLQFNWLYAILRLVFHLVQAIIRFLTVLFEGEGGVLWSVLLLVLIISIFSGSQ